ncbi:hypothetical protein C0Q70_09026 [Pomacea canaliculata]|uniref:Uncharacterized protein n=1 Tax=Pomacea canaliculata TaxID=400727 RepID=A0A2T7P8M9_POMCA|nr:hypothetical protein C0Q70_09026 [Pomacea canaliculata]
MSALKIPRLKGSACKVKASFNLPVVETSDSLLLKVSPAYMHVRTGRSRAHTNAGHCDMRTEYSGAARVRPVSSETTYGRSAELRGAYDKETEEKSLERPHIRRPEPRLSALHTVRSAEHEARTRQVEPGAWTDHPITSSSRRTFSGRTEVLRRPKRSKSSLTFIQQETGFSSIEIPSGKQSNEKKNRQVYKEPVTVSTVRCKSANAEDVTGTGSQSSRRTRWASARSAEMNSQSIIKRRVVVETAGLAVLRLTNGGSSEDGQTKEREVRKKRMESNDLLADRQVAWFMSLLQQCIRNNKLEKMRFVMKRLSLAQRRQLATFRYNTNSMLFTCCQMGHVDMVNYLLDECGADLEQKGVYEVSGDGSRHMVTPLWCAAVADHIDVVESLIKHGADLNSQSDTGSTPVRSACYMTNIEVVKRLVEAGADIHLPNMNGGTCLINSVQSPELCEFLIKHGARVNDRDKSNNLALHYAIREDRLDTVKLLVEYGSDYNAKNDYNDNALQTAALRGYEDIVEYLIESTRPSLVDALLIRERILGKNHKDTSFGVMYRGAVYADSRRFQRCVDLWKYAYHLRFTGCSDPLNHELVFTVQALVKLFWEMHVDETEEGSCEKLRCCDLVDTLEELIHHIQAAQTRIKMLQKEPASCITQAHQNSGSASIDTCPGYSVCACGKHREGNIEDFCLLMQLSIHLIFLFSAQPDVNDDVKHYFCTLVYQLLKIDARTQAGETLLHLALSVGKTNLTPDFCLKPLPVVKILLECGADADALTKAGQTPLLCCLRQENSMHNVLLTNEKRESLILCLLKHGAHADRAGHLPVVQFLKESRSFSVLDHVNLQCLAAQVICKHRILYKGMLPATLEKFVGMH